MLQPFLTNFVHSIRFGSGSINELPAAIKNHESDSCTIITDENVRRQPFFEKVLEGLDEAKISSTIYSGVEPDPNIDTIKDLGELVRKDGNSVVVGIGGGSSLDAAKCAALLGNTSEDIESFIGLNKCPRTVRKKILIPTTSGTGSEVTCVAVLTKTQSGGGDTKVLIKDPVLYAELALIDPDLTVSMPQSVTAATGMDAFTHAYESYTNNVYNPISDQFAIEAIKLIGQWLKRAVTDGTDLKARYFMSQASLFAGLAFANTATALVHAIAQGVGSRYHIAHGFANAVILPYIIKFNSPACIEKTAQIYSSLNGDIMHSKGFESASQLSGFVKQLNADIGIPADFSSIGVKMDEKEIKEILLETKENTPQLWEVNSRSADIEEVIEAIKPLLI